MPKLHLHGKLHNAYKFSSFACTVNNYLRIFLSCIEIIKQINMSSPMNMFISVFRITNTVVRKEEENNYEDNLFIFMESRNQEKTLQR